MMFILLSNVDIQLGYSCKVCNFHVCDVSNTKQSVKIHQETQNAVLGVVILFVRLSHACFVTNPRNLPAIFFISHERAILLVKCDFSYTSCAAADKISTDLRARAVSAAAEVLVFNMRRSEHITDVLISLQWLRVPDRIVFKVATLKFRALHGTAPPYMASQFTRVADMSNRRRLRSASSNQLDVPSFRLPLSVVVPFRLPVLGPGA